MHHAPRHAPFFTDPPLVVIGAERPDHASVDMRRHRIDVAPNMLRRQVLAHEVAHLLAWRDPHHGGEFCSTIARIWEAEFGIEVERHGRRSTALRPHQVTWTF